MPEQKDKNIVQTKTKQKKEKSKPVQRRMKENVSLHHDLFKLEVAVMLKNMSWNDIPDYHKIEHCHFFHTVDSVGKKQVFSTSVGGHFHLMEIRETEGVPEVVCKSGPLKWKKQKNKLTGQYEKVVVPVNDVDQHVHETTYLDSHLVTLRKINSEAVKVIGKNATLTTKPKGLDVGIL